MYLMKNIVGHNLILLLKLKSFNYFNDERILDKKKTILVYLDFLNKFMSTDNDRSIFAQRKQQIYGLIQTLQ